MAVPVTVMAEMFDNAGRTLVVGLGETGLSVARFLSRRGVPVAIVDSRTQPPGLERMRAAELADVALFLGGFSEEAFERAEQIVISPGVSMDEPHVAAAMARGIPVIGDIELFAQAVQAPWRGAPVSMCAPVAISVHRRWTCWGIPSRHCTCWSSRAFSWRRCTACICRPLPC